MKQQKYIDAIHNAVSNEISNLSGKYEKQLERAQIKADAFNEIASDIELVVEASIKRQVMDFFESQRGHEDSLFEMAAANTKACQILKAAIKIKESIDSGESDGTRSDVHNELYQAALESLKVLES